MNLAKLFKLPKKLGNSLLISLINNMVDYLRNYDSAIKVDDHGYIHLAADDLYLDADGSDIDIHGDGAIFLYSEYAIELMSGDECDIRLNSDAAIELNSNNEYNINIVSSAQINLTTDNENSINLDSNGGIYLDSNNENGIYLNSDGEIGLISNNGYNINLNSDNEINLTSRSGIYIIDTEGNDIKLSTQNGDYDRDLILWNDSDGLIYKQDNERYFQIDENGLIIIKERDALSANSILQDYIFGEELTHDIELHINNEDFGKLIINSIVDNEIIDISDTNQNITKSIRLRPDNTIITITYIYKSFNNGDYVIIKYKDNTEKDFDIPTNIGTNIYNSFTFCIEDIEKISYIGLHNGGYCYTADTIITLADGTTKQVKDITYDDELKVWNFDEGKDDVAKPLWIKRTEYAKSYQLVTLSDGNTIKLCGSDGKYHCMFDVTEQKFNHAVDCIGHEVYTENGIATVVSIEEVKEKVDHYNVVTNYHMNLYANHILTSTEKNNIYPIADMKFVKDDRKIVPYEEFEKAHISRKYYDGWRAGEWSEPLKDVITHLRRRKMYAKPQKHVKDGLRTDYFG